MVEEFGVFYKGFAFLVLKGVEIRSFVPTSFV